MKAVANNTKLKVPPEVVITHLDDVVTFSISRFDKDSFFNKGYDVFEEINQFWESLPLTTQGRIFEIYKSIQIAYDSFANRQELTDFLTNCSTELLEIHNLEIISDWLSFRSSINIPTSFVEEYVHSIDSNTSRDKTYTRADYKDLVALSLCMRCMIPIWSDYINHTKDDTGNEFKEFYAFQLIRYSRVLNSSAMIKLRTYIESLTVDKHTPDNVLKGISSEDFVYWLLALLCIKRLTIADLRGVDEKTNIITFVYKFIVQRVQNRDNNFENSYKEKKFDDKGIGNQENKISTLEKYKIKTNISPGEIVELEFIMRDMYNVAGKLSSRVTREMIDESLQTSQILNQYSLLEPQLTLLSWVFKPVISSKGHLYLPKHVIVSALGTLESVLIARGHEYLALIASAYHVSSDKEMMISPVDSKMRMPVELSQQIEELYPFTRPIPARRLKSSGKSNNIALDTIDNLADMLMMYNWRTSAHPSRVKAILGTDSRKISIKPNIKEYLGKLVIELGSRTWI